MMEDGGGNELLDGQTNAAAAADRVADNARQ